MMKTGLMVISHPNVVYRNLPKLISEINNVLGLYIHYFPQDKWNKNFTIKNMKSGLNKPNWPVYSSFIIGLYSKVLKYKHLDIRILLSGIKGHENKSVITKKPIDFICYDEVFTKDDVNRYISSCVQSKVSHCQIISLRDDTISHKEEETTAGMENGMYTTFDHVVLGGTFDRLHYGHKILLSEAILRCRKKITVGVTDTPMLKSKKLWELVEPCEFRIQKVKEFLEEVDPSLEYDVVPINDMYGPTKDDPTFQMLVVSSETTRGGTAVNEVRQSNGLDCLYIHEVGLLGDPNKEDEVEEDKISSSNLRMRCLGTLLRIPQPNPNVPKKPYIVGLTGGIASGKSKIAEYLASLGAGVVSCDHIGHEIYSVGTDGYKAVVEEFGEEILNESGCVDRKKLGAIVFGNKEKLKVLNELLWPLILQEALHKTRELYSQGHEVVVIEAAVMIVAGWQHYCHELWASIVSPDEAVKRVMERDSLTEEEARARLEAQPTNLDYVNVANIVFCSQWRVEYTRKQVDKAWTGLRQRLGTLT